MAYEHVFKNEYLNMKPFWWAMSTVNDEGALLNNMGCHMAEYDRFGVNSKFFHVLHDMNMLSSVDSYRLYPTNAYIVPKELIENGRNVVVKSRYVTGNTVAMINTGPFDIPISECVGLIPPLFKTQSFTKVVGEEKYFFPLTVPVGGFGNMYTNLVNVLIQASMKTEGAERRLVMEQNMQLLEQNDLLCPLSDFDMSERLEILLNLVNYFIDFLSPKDSRISHSVAQSLQEILRHVLDNNDVSPTTIATLRETFSRVFSNNLELCPKCVANTLLDCHYERGPVVCKPRQSFTALLL